MDLKEESKNVVDKVSGKLRDFASAAGEKTGEVADKTADVAAKAADKVKQTVKDMTSKD